jgi:cardiolipin synthase
MLSYIVLAIAAIFFATLMCFYVQGAFRRSFDVNLIGLPASSPHFAISLGSMADSHVTQGIVQQFWSKIDTIQQERLRAIAQAKQSIQFETFIMTPGRRADAFKDSLCERARAGVQIQLLVDSYGAKSLPDSYWRELTSAGAEIRFFNPFSWRDPISYLRRNHRKLLIIDQEFAMVGGAGISDMWDGVESKGEDIPWLDFEVQWSGSCIGFLTGLFLQHWLDAGGTVDLNQHKPTDAIRHTPHQADEPAGEPLHSSQPSEVVVTPGEDPTPADSSIRSLLQLCVLSAQERLWIASPYLLPDEATCKLLSSAHRQGVDVRILTMGPDSDKPYVYYVSRERYGPLLRQGIKLHEYQPNMMHAKVILVDRHWVSMGSANLDPRSFFHNDELNLCSNDNGLVQQLDAFFRKAFEESYRVQLEQWGDRPLLERIIGNSVNLFYWQL